MYDHIFGSIISKQPTSLVLRSYGVGFSINITLYTYEALPEVGAECLIYTYLQIKEDAHVLFGFLTAEERLFFMKLISVSGIGPMTAMRIMSGGRVEDLIAVIRNSNIAALSKIKGIGKKTAERLIVELKSSLDEISTYSSTASNPILSAQQKDAIAALVTLGYNEKEAWSAVNDIIGKNPNASVDMIIREALKAF